MKKGLLLILTFLLLFGAVAYAYAQEQPIGSPYVSLGYDDVYTLEDIVAVVPVGQEGDDIVAGIEPNDPSWKPAWSHVPMSRYWFDSSGNFIEKWGPILKPGSFENTGHKIILLIANIFFTISMWISRVSIEVLLLGFNTHLLVHIGQDAISVASSIWSGDAQHSGIRNTLLLMVLVLAGFYYIFRLLQAKFSDIIRAALVTVLVLGLSAAYFANADKILTSAINITSSISAMVFTIIPADEEIPIDNPQQRGLVGFAGNVWDIMVVTPWAYGQFGTVSTSGLEITGPEKGALEAQLEPNVKDHDNYTSIKRIDQMLLALPVGSSSRHTAVDVFQDEQIDHGGHSQTTWTLSPGRSMTVVILSVTTLVASFIFLIFSMFVGVLLLIAEITIIFGLLAAPFVAVIALIPETGWNVAIKWTKIMVSALLAKIFYGIYAGIIFLLISTIMIGDTLPFFFKMLMLCIILVFALLFRKKFMDLVTGVVKLDKEQKATTGGSERLIGQLVRWKLLSKVIQGKKSPGKSMADPKKLGKDYGRSSDDQSVDERDQSSRANSRMSGNSIAEHLRNRARPASNYVSPARKEGPASSSQPSEQPDNMNKGQRYVVRDSKQGSAIYNLSKNTSQSRKKGANWIKDMKGMKGETGRPVMPNAVRDSLNKRKYKHQPAKRQPNDQSNVQPRQFNKDFQPKPNKK